MSCPLPVTDVLYQTAACPHPDPLPQAGEGGRSGIACCVLPVACCLFSDLLRIQKPLSHHERRDILHAFALADAREDEGALATLLPGVAVHHLQ